MKHKTLTFAKGIAYQGFAGAFHFNGIQCIIMCKTVDDIVCIRSLIPQKGNPDVSLFKKVMLTSLESLESKS